MTMFRNLRAMFAGDGPGAGALLASNEVEAAIARADMARDRGDWALAADEYRAALALDDGLDHIWVQLGHASKEADNYSRAVHAYQQAIRLDWQEPDRHLHLAHLFKNRGQADGAIDHFLRAFLLGEDRLSEQRELLTLMQQKVSRGQHRQLRQQIDALTELPVPVTPGTFLDRLLQTVAAEEEAAQSAETALPDLQAAMVFDISDLIGFWRNARLPTGIQRVQIEAITAALAEDDGPPIRLCCFTQHRDDWLEVPVDTFTQLTALATSGGDPEDEDWREAISALDLHLSLTPPFTFPYGAMLINLGTSWWLQNYFLYVRHAKAERGIRYIPFVHDMIPIMTPEHCTRELTQDFISWAMGVFEYADHYLVNSESTRKDLLAVARQMGHQVEESDVAVVRLDTDFRKPAESQLPDSALAQWDLAAGDFALFVSTIESRKGHIDAFEAWASLIDKHGAEAVPQLVCVGNRGWLNDRIYERLAIDTALAEKVTMLSRLTDAELALLYRTCRFTVYPSLYEGWGLPVTESLCYGKVPLISDAASLPEAGGTFAVYVDPQAPDQLADEAERLIFDNEHRQVLEERIASDFAPRRWSDLAQQIVAELESFAASDRIGGAEKGSRTPRAAPVARIGRWHAMQRNVETRVWHGMGSAEKYRSSLGWFWPEARGTRIRGSSGELRFRIDRAHPALRLTFALLGDENERCRYAISCAGTELTEEIEPGARRWVWLDVPASTQAGDITVTCAALPAIDGALPTYFVTGFHLRETADEAARQDFIEAVTLDRLDAIEAFAEQCPPAATLSETNR